MVSLLRGSSLLPSCILAGVGIIFVVLAAVLPPGQVIGLIGGSAVVVGLVVARMRRFAAEDGQAERWNAKG